MANGPIGRHRKPTPNEPMEISNIEKTAWVRYGQKAWKLFRPIFIVLLSIFIICFGMVSAVKYAIGHYYSPVSTTDNTPVVFVIEKGMGRTAISKSLQEQHIIRNKTVFKYYIDLLGYGNRIKAGTYILNPTMSIQEIVEKFCKGDSRGNTTTFIAIEGNTIDEIATSLVKQNIIKDKTKFLSLCKDGKDLVQYNMVSDLVSSGESGRRYLLEGYLFPAKYEIYVGATEEEIIGKMVNQMESVLNQTYLDRAAEIGMTVDEVLTLASIIEEESLPKDFDKVSAVFHNRIKAKMPLQSDITVQYILGIKRLMLTDKDTAVDSPYNTYKYAGLPLGPVCSPSRKAIEAALYPNEEYIDQGYLYFTLKDPESGELEFNKTLKEHNKAVEKYKPLWDAYDKAHGS